VLGVISQRGQPLSALVRERIRLFPASGEINRRLSTDTATILARVRGHYEARARSIDVTDGLSMEFAQWRFNLRGSNTEPLVRLNVESRGDEPLMREKTAEVLKLVEQ
jgi:phosphomannomutase